MQLPLVSLAVWYVAAGVALFGAVAAVFIGVGVAGIAHAESTNGAWEDRTRVDKVFDAVGAALVGILACLMALAFFSAFPLMVADVYA